MEDSPHNPQIHYAQAHIAESVGNGKTATTGFTTSTCGTEHPAVMKRQLLPQATGTDSNNSNSTISHCPAPNIQDAIKPTLASWLDQ